MRSRGECLRPVHGRFDDKMAWQMPSICGSPRLLTFWDILNMHLDFFAADVAHEVNLLHHLENTMSQWDGAKDINDQHTLKNIKERAESVLRIATSLNLNISKQKAAILSHSVSNNLHNVSDLRSRTRELRETMLQEIFTVKFLPASKDMESYLDKTMPFGETVSQVFPNSIEDISEAHQCFAFERYSASMFHLGRAMELGVKAVAKKMRVTIKRDDWQSYLNAMNDKVAKMPFKTPKQKAQRAPFAETAAYLLHFKEAWRNPTMHPKKTYTREEALEVLNGAGTFLRYVSREIFKAKPVP